MSMKIYGNLMNRLQENGTTPKIEEGMDITMYLWSDRTCYYVTKVIDQKHIKVKRYIVIADLDKERGMGHQNWLYFKTPKEVYEYLEAHGIDSYRSYYESEKEEDWEYRYNKWQHSIEHTEENYCTERELQSLRTKGFYKRYFDLGGKVRFGIRDYYYDWEF